MAIFDALPRGYQDFLITYPRGVKAWDARAILEHCGGDIDRAITEIRALLPVEKRRAA